MPTIEPLDAEDLVKRYRAGVSLFSLSRDAGISRWSLARQIEAAGVGVRGLDEAARLRAGRPADAVPLYTAAEECRINRKVLASAIRAGILRATRVDEPGTAARYHVVLSELREDLAARPRCDAPGCEQPALRADGTCGTCGAGRKRPRTPPGTVALSVAAERTGINRRTLARAVGARLVRATTIKRPGTGTRYQLAVADLEVPRCRRAGCERLAVTAGGLCGRCALEATVEHLLLSEGLVPLGQAAREHIYLTPEGLVFRGVVVRREFGGMVRLGVNAREVLHLSLDKNARRRLSKPLAALNRTEAFGRPRSLSEAEVQTVVSLRSADPATWGWRTLADRLNETRPPDERVSYVTVKRAFERETKVRAPPLLQKLGL